MKPLKAEELARYWKFEPVIQGTDRKFTVTQFFGKKSTSPAVMGLYKRFGWEGHSGHDIVAVYAPTYAPFAGKVLNYRDEENNENARGDFLNIVSEAKNIGNQWIRLRAHWFHLNRILVKESNWFREHSVEAGQKVAITGNTGKLSDGTPLSTGPHLHFGIYPQYLNESTERWEEDKKNGYGGAVDPVYFFRPEDIRNYPTDIKQEDMLRLVKGMNSKEVYALGNTGKKHYLYNEKQLRLGSQIGLWVQGNQIEYRLQAEIDEIEEGEPIILGVI
jgi:murein DD-endopeptidase MepM/ murein hydrolase activator NlpD|tara:strand:+ start:386 stop:1210 length:825 start_codon:yes stop_codon:yes gene_type:complete